MGKYEEPTSAQHMVTVPTSTQSRSAHLPIIQSQQSTQIVTDHTSARAESAHLPTLLHSTHLPLLLLCYSVPLPQSAHLPVVTLSQ